MADNINQNPIPKVEGEVVKTRRVASEPGQIKKTSTFRKLTRIFLTDDPETALTNMAQNVLIPNFKKGLVDAFSMIVLGHPAFGNGVFGLGGIVNNVLNPPTSQTPYWAFGNTTPTPPQNALIASSNPTKFNGSVWFRDANVAMAVRDEMIRVITQYHRVSLSELYNAAGLPDNDYQQGLYWGWTDLSQMQLYPEGGGYTLRMPPIQNIK